MMGNQPIERTLARWWAANARRLGLRPNTYVVASVVLTRTGQDRPAKPGRTRISEDANIGSRATLSAALNEAEEAGLLTIKRRGNRQTNLYYPGPALIQFCEDSPGKSDGLETGTSENSDGLETGTSETDLKAQKVGHQTGVMYQFLTSDGLETDPLTGKENDKRETLSASFEKVAEQWNRIASETGLVECQPVGKWPKSRAQAVQARIKEHGLDVVKEVLSAPLGSRFLRGETGRETWSGASFDWLLRPSNFIKVLEGAYRDNSKTKSDTNNQAGAHENEPNSTGPSRLRIMQEGCRGLQEDVSRAARDISHPEVRKALTGAAEQVGLAGALGSESDIYPALEEANKKLMSECIHALDGDPELASKDNRAQKELHIRNRFDIPRLEI